MSELGCGDAKYTLDDLIKELEKLKDGFGGEIKVAWVTAVVIDDDNGEEVVRIIKGC
jgi:hypothetical protein